jgi:molybdate transport system regulatory protein
MGHLRLTFVLDSGARIGPGKAALLRSVQASGSISAAARLMGMDYKRAWLLIDSLNQAFVTPIVERSAGGAGGGGAVLTPFGQELLERYSRLEETVKALAKSDLKALERKAAPESGPKI